MYAEGRATPSMGVSGALGKQADRRARSRGTLSRTDEPAKRARLANMARLSVAQIAVAALKLAAVLRKYFLNDRRAKVETVAAATLQRVAHKQR